MTANAAHIPELPAPEQLDRAARLFEPLVRLMQPKLYGIENVPAGGALLVGNHTIYGVLDVPFMVSELWTERNIMLRGLGDHAHYRLPGWRDLLESFGMVRGTRANCGELMRRREHILVFPGGSREVYKRKGEKYTLLWKERVGFARMALEHDYPIVPFAAVGAEEMLDVVLDADDALVAPFARLVEKALNVPLPPLVRGIGPTMLPRPQRLYFWFGAPIAATDHPDPASLRDAVKQAVEGGVAFLLEEREKDPQRGLAARLLGRG